MEEHGTGESGIKERGQCPRDFEGGGQVMYCVGVMYNNSIRPSFHYTAPKCCM